MLSMNELELWLDVLGYEGLYQVSNFGRMKSLGRKVVVKQDRYSLPRTMNWKSRILKTAISKPRNNKGSYVKTTLRKDGISRTFEVHRLVATAFVPNPDEKPVVNHIDFDGTNNHHSNLEWCTIRENNMHSIHKRRYPAIFKSFFNEADRATLNALFDAGIGVTAIAYQLNLPYGSVRYVYRLRNNP